MDELERAQNAPRALPILLKIDEILDDHSPGNSIPQDVWDCVVALRNVVQCASWAELQAQGKPGSPNLTTAYIYGTVERTWAPPGTTKT